MPLTILASDCCRLDGFQEQSAIYDFSNRHQGQSIEFETESQVPPLVEASQSIRARAMQQLVLIGDVSTLTQARDRPFRDTAQALLTHVRQRGELLSYVECQARLATRKPEAP